MINQHKKNYSLIRSFLFKQKMTFKKYSILRILQIEELKKISIDGEILDIGGKKTPNNVTNYIGKKVKYLDKFSKDNDDIILDLEIDLQKQNANYSNKFDYVLLMNVLEHIYNFNNCLDICYNLGKTKGKLIGSTPFYFRIHGSPNDFFRYTEEALNISLRKAGYKEITIFPLAGGIFISFYSNIFLITSKIPLLNNLLLPIFILLDKFLSLFTKSYKYIMPIGYFFVATK